VLVQGSGQDDREGNSDPDQERGYKTVPKKEIPWPNNFWTLTAGEERIDVRRIVFHTLGQ